MKSSAKVGPNINSHKFASDSLEYNKLNASTQTCHVTNQKATLLNNAFQKKQHILSKKNSEIESLLSYVV